MEAVPYNANTVTQPLQSLQTSSSSHKDPSSGSPKQQSLDPFTSAFTEDAMSNARNVNNGSNHNATYPSSSMNANKTREESFPRPGRQDSISFYTNFGNGSRFSTDSNSSISNFLNFDQPAYDSNGRGMSIINNMFLPPTSGSMSSGYPQGRTTAGTSVSNGAPPPPPQNFVPGNDYSNYSQYRRPSEQLEPFNPSIQLKIPSFSAPKRPSVAYPSGNSFSESNGDFNFFNKRDSVRTRQPSFTNPNYNENYFDFFAKRDSLKNLTEEDLLKEVSNIPKAPATRSEPDTNNAPTIPDSVPERPQTAMGNDSTPFLGINQQYNPQSQQLQTPQQQQQQHQHQHQHFDYTDQFNQRPRDPPSQPLGGNITLNQPDSVPTTSKKRGSRKKQKVIQEPSPNSAIPTDTSVPTRRNAIQPSYPKQEVSPVAQPSHLSPTASSQYSNSSDKKLIPGGGQDAGGYTEDGRPLLGATKVDQLMLVIQARKKGIHNQIPQASDGSIIDTGNGVLPQHAELVGGIDKPKTKGSKHHECQYCHKTFTQSTHLEVHVRSHIGLKPYECKFCGKKFTQGGNLRTHMRLHTGEKPYKCETCGRDFSRKGNLAAHKLTHDNLKPYECKLDNCGKAFTQLGNLKAHQNRFHLNTLNELTKKLAETDPDDKTMSKDERDLLDYFASLYKNSNRGIKGRGKKTTTDTTTGATTVSSPVQSKNSVGSHSRGGDAFSGFDDTGFEIPADSKSIAFKNVNYQQ
ncbi:CYFA0S19e00276g1_1 [Cyberlindnera fabianii]|uniref:CYFA0S19e00276g1_1 n=1 Tax=Cyberlindnera fabianii TaxID=36022 RepID=A0A061BF30_CYBFA|nr:CYFA0S19e00276g1_1 [Cyberlindnera fabianii]